jgi:hypothetical protein
MKTIVGLIVVVTIVLGTMVGCQTTPSEQGYQDLSLGPMTVSIPDDWQRPEDYEGVLEELFINFSEEDKQVIQVDVYEDKSEDAFLFMERIDMVGVFELDGLTWRGWDIELEEVGKTTEDFAEMIQGNLTGGFTELTQEVHRQLTIGGREAWETTYTAEFEGEPVQVCFSVVFAPDDAGIVLMIVTQTKWSNSEDVWDTIKNSVRI